MCNRVQQHSMAKKRLIVEMEVLENVLINWRATEFAAKHCNFNTSIVFEKSNFITIFITMLYVFIVRTHMNSSSDVKINSFQVQM